MPAETVPSPLAPDMQEKFDKLSAAYEKAREARDEASAKLADQLEEIVGAERMKPKYPAYQYQRQGGQAPKKAKPAPKTEEKVF